MNKGTASTEADTSPASEQTEPEGRIAILEMQVQNLQDRTHTLEMAFKALVPLVPGGAAVLEKFFGLIREDGAGGK